LAKTLSDLLDWSKVQRGAYDWNPVPFALAPVVQESMLLTQSAATSKGVTVRLQIAKEEKVFADPILILTRPQRAAGTRSSTAAGKGRSPSRRRGSGRTASG
jgi:signal transduction histidine kinase